MFLIGIVIVSSLTAADFLEPPVVVMNPGKAFCGANP